MKASAPDLKAIATEAVTALAGHRQISTFSGRYEGFSLADAYRLPPLLRAAFEERGETITGRKIGFTNRQMWTVYGVDAPIWGYSTDRTTFSLEDTPVQRVTDFLEPRIEPEIMFGLAAAPSADMDELALLDCIAWVALGYEVVQSVFPGWKFAASDSVAANALHGALLIGNRHAIAPRRAACDRNSLTSASSSIATESSVRPAPARW